jgi:hypothetical protein
MGPEGWRLQDGNDWIYRDSVSSTVLRITLQKEISSCGCVKLDEWK